MSETPSAPKLTYDQLWKAYQELDENSKSLVRTDLELHQASSKIENQVSTLLILNKLSDLRFEKAWIIYESKNGQQPFFMHHGASLSERPLLLNIANRCRQLAPEN